MLTVNVLHGGPSRALGYYQDGGEYFAAEREGQWEGKGAAALGLSGAASSATLAALLRGELPSGARIPHTFAGKKRMALDLTFSAPKSVSLQALVADDPRLKAAHDAAVKEALAAAEGLAAARQKVKGKSAREHTKNLVVVEFRHELSRNLDPQLHTHALVLNLTKRADGQWRALSNEDIFRAQKALDATYKASLAASLQGLGFSIRRTDEAGGFELAHISRSQIDAFSTREQAIAEHLAIHGKTLETATVLERRRAAVLTRRKKIGVQRDELQARWRALSQTLGIDYLPTPIPEAHIRETHRPNAVLRWTIEHLTERRAVVSESELIATALQRAVGETTPAAVKAEIDALVRQGILIVEAPRYHPADEKAPQMRYTRSQWRSQLAHLPDPDAYIEQAIARGTLVRAEPRYTTQVAIQRERAILAIEAAGRDRVTPIMAPEIVREATARTTLNADQRAAVERMLGTRHRIVGVQGDAGTGKTYMLNTAIGWMARAGKQVVVVAPYGGQVKALEAEGIPAATLARFLATKKRALDENTVVILDEAAVVPARQMLRLLRHIEIAGARLITLGDTKQTAAIEAGKPFAQLQNAGMTTSRLREIQRQTTPALKAAVAEAAAGKLSDSLARLPVVEIADAEARYQRLVADWMALSPDARDSTLIVAGTNEARRAINARIREALGLKGVGVVSLARADLTTAQRGYAPSFEREWIIVPEQDGQGLKKGDAWTVCELLPNNRLEVEREGHRRIVVARGARWSVFIPTPTDVAVGDRLRVNHADRTRGLVTGDRLRVVGIAPAVEGNRLLLQTTSGRPVDYPLDQPLPLEHAYASTVHSAQGLTCDRVLIDYDTESPTTYRNVYYVAISRARQEARIYTNSRARLPEAVLRRREKAAALELR